MDSKGTSIAILTISNKKVIVKENETFHGSKINLKIFNVLYPYGFHAEVRCLLTILRNPFYLQLVKNQKNINMTTIRYSKTGKMGKSSKPCKKCQEVMKQFKKTILNNNINIIVKYYENDNLKEMII